MALTRIPKRCISVNTPDKFEAIYKKYEIGIYREKDERGFGHEFYIAVIAPNGCYAYNGWWGDDSHTMTEAVAEAIKGSCIP